MLGGEGTSDSDGDGWTDAEFWAAAGICITIAIIVFILVSALVVLRCRSGPSRGGSHTQGAVNQD